MKKITIISLAVVLLIGIGTSTYFLLNKNKDIKNIINNETKKEQSNEVKIKELEIDTGATFSRNMQDSPVDLITSKGNYIFYNYGTKKLIYNGKDIEHNGKIEFINLSHNGEHYIYVSKNESNEEYNLYIDNIKTFSSAHLIYNPIILNDGKTYFYALEADMVYDVGDRIFKNDKEIFRYANGILNFTTNTDGSIYFAKLRKLNNEGTFNGISLIKNGKEIYSGTEPRETLISENGEHYAYTFFSNEKINDKYVPTIIIDGVEYNGYGTTFQKITNSGNYITVDYATEKSYLNNKLITSDKDSKVYINNDASNILIRSYNTGKLSLDGKDLGINISLFDDIEINDNTIYIYRIKDQDLTGRDTELNVVGTIEGSLGYPSEGIPSNMKICAEDVNTKQQYCTTEHIKNKKYTYGEGYQIDVPVGGEYYVFASILNGTKEDRAYYSEFVTCGLKIGCSSHNPIKVKVSLSETISNIDPQDWYNNK